MTNSVTPIDTCATTLYAVVDQTTNTPITIKGRTLHTTRSDARSYRKLTQRTDVKIMKCDFTNYTDWTSVK